eukprot:6350554-Amphidinium_carterae.1
MKELTYPRGVLLYAGVQDGRPKYQNPRQKHRSEWSTASVLMPVRAHAMHAFLGQQAQTTSIYSQLQDYIRPCIIVSI